MSRGRAALLHLLFLASIVAKGIDGVLEIVGGALLLAISPDQLYRGVRVLTQHELSEDPHDFIAGHLLHTARHLSAHAVTFGALYLLWHGAVKAGLVAALLRRRYWAYPVAIAAFAVFLSYQLYRYALSGSLWMLALSALDVAVIALTWIEYRQLRGRERGHH